MKHPRKFLEAVTGLDAQASPAMLSAAAQSHAGLFARASVAAERLEFSAETAARCAALSDAIIAAIAQADLGETSYAPTMAEKPEPNPEWEALADAYHAASLEECGVEPEATLAMLRRWKADAEPANALGQISFSRAMLESATDALAATLARIAELEGKAPHE